MKKNSSTPLELRRETLHKLGQMKNIAGGDVITNNISITVTNTNCPTWGPIKIFPNTLP